SEIWVSLDGGHEWQVNDNAPSMDVASWEAENKTFVAYHTTQQPCSMSYSPDGREWKSSRVVFNDTKFCLNVVRKFVDGNGVSLLLAELVYFSTNGVQWNNVCNPLQIAHFSHP